MPKYYEVSGSPVERWNLREAGVTEIERVVVCDWRDRHLVAELAVSGELATYYREGLGETPLMSRYVSVEPFGAAVESESRGDGQFAKYEKAAVKIVYTLEDRAPQPLGPRVTEAIEPYEEVYQGPEVEVEVQIEEGVSRRERTFFKDMGFLYNVTYHDAKQIHPAVISLIGCVNASPVPIMGGQLVVDSQCLLYVGPRIDRASQLGSVDKYRVSLNFKSRRFSWNLAWVPETQVFAPIIVYAYDRAWQRMKEYTYTPHRPVDLRVLLP